MSKRSDKLNHAAHVKKSTRGTSNELSFSVLDAARNALDDGKDPSSDQARGFGRIRLFTLPIGRRKPPATPKKDELAALMGGSSPVPSSASSTPSLVKPVESDKPSSEAPAVPLPQAEPKAPKPAQPFPLRKARRRKHLAGVRKGPCPGRAQGPEAAFTPSASEHRPHLGGGDRLAQGPPSEGEDSSSSSAR